MPDIVVLDRIFNGFRIPYDNKYDYNTITKYIQDNLLDVIKKNNLYNLIQPIYNLKFTIYKVKSDCNVIYAQSINKYEDCLNEIDDFKKLLDIKDKVIQNLYYKLNLLDGNMFDSLIKENKDIKDACLKSNNQCRIINNENKKLKIQIEKMKSDIETLEKEIINEKYRFNYLL